MSSKYYTALCCDQTGKWMKYRNIREDKLTNFERFAKLKNVKYINYYDKQTKQYVKRSYL
jgi:hypothetical protein